MHAAAVPKCNCGRGCFSSETPDPRYAPLMTYSSIPLIRRTILTVVLLNKGCRDEGRRKDMLNLVAHRISHCENCSNLFGALFPCAFPYSEAFVLHPSGSRPFLFIIQYFFLNLSIMALFEISQENMNMDSPLPITHPNPVHLNGSALDRKLQVKCNWATFDERPLSGKSLTELFSNNIPTIRHSKLLSAEECARLVDIIKTAEVVSLSVTLYFRSHEKILVIDPFKCKSFRRIQSYWKRYSDPENTKGSP